MNPGRRARRAAMRPRRERTPAEAGRESPEMILAASGPRSPGPLPARAGATALSCQSTGSTETDSFAFGSAGFVARASIRFPSVETPVTVSS